MGSHPHRRARTGIRRRGQRGAAAVEFALVSVILFPLLLGIIDYGLWFNDSLNTRQGVRETARQGVVPTVTAGAATYSAPSGCSAASDQLQKLACIGTKQVAPSAGNVWTKVLVPSGWKKAQPLIVCAMVKETGVTGITPLPQGNVIKSKTQMSIEVDSAVPTGSAASGQTTAVWPNSPAPGSWSWCA